MSSVIEIKYENKVPHTAIEGVKKGAFKVHFRQRNKMLSVTNFSPRVSPI